MSINIQGLFTRARGIKEELLPAQNTALRVGSLLEDIISYLEENDAAWRSGGGSTPAALSHPLSDINLLGTNPDGNDKILLYNSGSWGYADKPTGGGGGGTTLEAVWNSLAGNDATKQINAAHLSDALDNYVTNSTLNSCSWWGRSLINGAVTGNLEGNINSITFSNGVSLAIDSNNANTLRVYKANGDAANLYASGGVSALGVGVSGGGSGGDGATLNALLDSINENTDTLPTLTAGMTVMRNSNNTKWIASKLALNNLSDTSISGLSSGQVLVYRNGSWSNETYTPGTQGSTTLSGLSDVEISQSISTGQILYKTSNATNAKWTNAIFSINPNTNTGTLLTGISFNGTDYKITDTKDTTGTNNLSNTKLYLVGASEQSSAAVTNTNSNCYLESDGMLYFGGSEAINTGALNTKLEEYFNQDGSAKKAVRLTDNATKTAWGQTYWSGGQPQNVNGDLSYVGSINMDGAINIDRTDGDPYINMKSTSGIQNVLLVHNDSDPSDNYNDAHVALGYGTAVKDQLPIKFFGREFVFEYATKNYTESGNSRTYSTDEAMKVGYMSIPVGQNPDDAIEEPAVYVKKNLFVGDGSDHYFPITYDYTRRALCFTGSIYATGGVSALGFQSTENGGALINGPLTVSGATTLNGNVTAGNVTVNNDISVAGNGIVNGDLTVDGNLEVTAEGTFMSPSIITGVITTSEINTTSLTVDGNSTLAVVSNTTYPSSNRNICISYKKNNVTKTYKLNMERAIELGLFTEV